jgi:hypothetical protein
MQAALLQLSQLHLQLQSSAFRKFYTECYPAETI